MSSSENACDCEHRGECLEDGTTCFCSHGFTGTFYNPSLENNRFLLLMSHSAGARCQKRVRKALLVGGLKGTRTRSDTELVAGLEVRRCQPPDYPTNIMAATGNDEDDHDDDHDHDHGCDR